MCSCSSRYGQTSLWRYVWLPSVITSAPASKRSSASLGVIPTPPATFSPLTTTKSRPNSSRSPGRSARRVRRPGPPTTSPTNRIAVTYPTVPAGGRSPEAQEPAKVLESEPRPGVEPVVVPRWVQLVTLPLAIVGVVALLDAAGPIVLLFTIAAVVALLLNPFVTRLRRRGVPRGPAVLITWLGVVLVVVGMAILLANPIADQVTRFRNTVPGLV